MADFELSPSIASFLTSLQKATLPGVWSKGVAQARSGAVQLEKFSEEEISVRVQNPDRPVSARVQLWPEDQDHFCDCNEKADPCFHVAACVAALKSGALTLRGGAIDEARPNAPPNTLRYGFRRLKIADGSQHLIFERMLGEQPFLESLVAYVGGIDSGRISGPKVSATQDDYGIDRLIASACPSRSADQLKRLFRDRSFIQKVLPALRDLSQLTLDSDPITVGGPTTGLKAEVREDRGGFRLCSIEVHSDSELFANGFILLQGRLHLLEDPGLSPEERQMLSPPGRLFLGSEIQKLVTEVLPKLERKIPVEIRSNRLPQVTQDLPQLKIELSVISELELRASISISYSSEFSIRGPEQEQALLRSVHSELHLTPGHWAHFTGLQALEFTSKAREFSKSHSGQCQITGDAGTHFLVHEPLKMGFEFSLNGNHEQTNLTFSSGDKRADPRRVLKAWTEGSSLVPLLGGGFSRVPEELLSKYGSALIRILELKDSNQGTLPAYAIPEAIILSEEISNEYGVSPAPDQANGTLKRLRALIDDFETIPQADLPHDLRADLRNYQKVGVSWLSLLRDSEMGALLADDMGLGKTLQALCCIRGKSLIVAPASVLQSWADQASRFRPALQVNLYWGSQRELKPEADLTITSYGLLRQDALLLEQSWDCAILDEAQTIKNPDSQMARAAHRIQARFRLALSGTPVENRLADLWSQFEFLNPGLLGSRRQFQDEWAGPVERGDLQRASRLKKRLKPFILRRLKRDVAPELPAKTEVVLQCDLSETERELYATLMASTRREVLESLENGGSVFSALELLLRLRQASCHPQLVPGQLAETSSKLELLMDNLETTLAEGHRALVFSQWTSFLDLIEARLEQSRISKLRLDGSTNNRGEIVAQFQAKDGPAVLLLSLKAGGVGLTLTAADHVFLMDSWWNPAVEDQAADRAHRIGQENPVLVCRMVARDTVEERILELQKQKIALAQNIVGSSTALNSPSLTKDDLLYLLQ